MNGDSCHAASPAQRRIVLVDLLDRVLAGGVIIAGDVTLSLAGVDLIRISLRALISSVGALESGRNRPEAIEQ